MVGQLVLVPQFNFIRQVNVL